MNDLTAVFWACAGYASVIAFGVPLTVLLGL